MRKVYFLVLCVLLIAALSLPTLAHTATVYDQADLIPLRHELQMKQPYDCDVPNGVNFYVVTASNRMTSREVVNLCHIGNDENAVVLVIDRQNDTYYYEMFTYNWADDALSDSEVDDILDDPEVYEYIKGGYLYAGWERFCTLVESELQAQAQLEREREARKPLMSVIVGLVVAVLAGGGTALGVFLYYRRKQHGETYPLDRYARMHLTESHDRFVGSFVTRVRVQSNNGGSGGGGRGPSGGSRGRR
ncbi:MAG: hypothetical protein IJX39_03945 [Clostridia bacterium]|nr:hypothetical protein [Clostridia bacterium]